ncbi:MAG: META domain-containing protein, partial [Actinomycetota bacterium]
MRTGWATVLVAILVAVGCGDPAEPAVDISGTWWAVELDGEPIEIDRNTAEIPWFEITGSTIGGSLGCNSGGGSYRLRGNLLFVSSPDSEAQLCG